MPMKRGKLIQEMYKCLDCGTSRTINRLAKKKTGHKKHMMCAGCGKTKSKFLKVG